MRQLDGMTERAQFGNGSDDEEPGEDEGPQALSVKCEDGTADASDAFINIVNRNTVLMFSCLDTSHREGDSEFVWFQS